MIDALRFVGLYKVIFLTEDDLVILLFAEKRFQIRSKAGKNIHQRGDRGRSHIVFELGDKSL